MNVASVFVAPIVDSLVRLLQLIIYDGYIYWDSDVRGYIDWDSDVRRAIEMLIEKLTGIRYVLMDGNQKSWMATSDEKLNIWLEDLDNVMPYIEDLVEELYWAYDRDDLNRERKLLDKMKEVLTSLDTITTEEVRYALANSEKGRSLRSSKTDSYTDDGWIFGLDDDRKKVIDSLLVGKSEAVNICCIVGMGGIGKTTLAKLVFGDSRIVDAFPLRIWVRLSGDFPMNSLMGNILEAIEGRPTPKALEEWEISQEVQTKICGKKFLLVLDDINYYEYGSPLGARLLALELKDAPNGSAIIFTTRVEKIADDMDSCSYHVHRMHRLSEEDSWGLFEKIAVRGPKDDYMEIVGRDMSSKCQGVPLAIEALGRLFIGKIGEREWRSVLEGKRWEVQIKRILRVLNSSSLNLQMRSTRPLAYCYIFPDGFEIDEDNLIALWISNRLVSCFEEGTWVIDKLVSKSLILRTGYAGTRCKIHDLVRYPMFISKEFFRTESGTAQGELPTEVRHLWCDVDSVSGQVVEFSGSKLRSLFIAGGSGDTELNCESTLLSKQTGLQVLSITRCRGISSNLLCFEKLRSLRYLDLSYSDIEKLPESVAYLFSLEYLILKGCKNLTEIPRLRTGVLRSLDIRGCRSLTKMHQIKQLVTPGTWVNGLTVNWDDPQQLFDLPSLKLRGYMRLQNINNSKDAKPIELKKHENIRSLRLSWDEDRKGSPPLDFDNLEPHSGLIKIRLDSYPGAALPTWLDPDRLKELLYITLYNCKAIQSGSLHFLESFRLLEGLHIQGMPSVDRYLVNGNNNEEDESPVYPALKFLTLNDMPGLIGWADGKRGKFFPQLKKAYIANCLRKDLTLDEFSSVINLSVSSYLGNEFPAGLEKLNALEVLEVKSCDNLKAFPGDAKMQGLYSLRTLWIRDCKKLISLSSGVKHLKALQDLFIEGCPYIKTLPDEMEHLSALKKFEIRDCELLSALPDCLGTLRALSCLKIAFCPQLDFLPRGLGSSPALKELHIVECKKLKYNRGDEGSQTIACIPQVYINYIPQIYTSSRRLAEGIEHTTKGTKKATLIEEEPPIPASKSDHQNPSSNEKNKMKISTYEKGESSAAASMRPLPDQSSPSSPPSFTT